MEKVGCVMPASPLRLLLKEYMDRLGSLRSEGKLDASTYGAEVAACEHLRKNPEAIESATLSNCFYAWGNRSLFSEAERRGYVRFLMAVLLKGQSLSFHMCMCKLEAQLRLEVLLNDMQYVQNDGARELCHNEAPCVVSMVVRDMMSLLAPTPKILRDRTVTKWVKYIEGYYDKSPLVAKMVKEMRRMRKYLEMLESEDTLSKACISQEEVDELRSQFHNCVQRLSYFREELRLSALAEFTELSDKRSERSKGRRNDGGRYSSEYDFNVSLLWKLIGDIWDDCARIPFVLCVPFTRIRLLSFYGVLGPINNAATIDKFRGSQACNDGSAFEDVCMTSHWPTIVQRIVVPHCAELIRLHGMEEPLADESLVEPLARDWVSWCLQKNDENHSEPTGLWTHELPLYTRYSNCTILKQGKSVGELDAVIVDARQSNVLFVLEIKRNIADVEKAVKQRNRFFEMVDTSPIQLKCGTETLTMENLAAFFRNKDAEDDSPGRNARWVIVTSAPRDLSSCTALPAPGPVRHLIENALVRICEEALLHADPRADDAWRARDVVLNSSFLCQPSSNTGVYTPLTLPLELADPDSNLVPPPDMSVMDFFVQHLSPTTLAAHPIRLSSNLPLLDLIDRVRDPSTTFESVAEKMCPPKQPQPSFISLVKELVGHGSLRTLILVKELASTDDSS